VGGVLLMSLVALAATVAAAGVGVGAGVGLGVGVGAVIPAPMDLSDTPNTDLELGPEPDSAQDPHDVVEMEMAARAAAGAGMHSRRKRFTPPLPRDGLMSRVAYAKAVRREKLTRRLREGGMLRRYAPDLFNADVYGVDDNDNVKVGSRATIWDALNGPFAPMKPKRDPVDAGVVSKLLNEEDKKHEMADRRDNIRHIEDAAALAGRDPYAAGFTYLPANHRTKPFGFGRLIARARLQQSLDVGPFEKSSRTWNHNAANPMASFRGFDHSPLPYTPRLPFAEADAAFQGQRPSKLQQWPEFTPPPQMPKFAAPPADKGGDAAASDG